MKIKRLLLICTVFTLSTIIFTKCVFPSQKKSDTSIEIEEGIIEYSISWPKNFGNSNSVFLFPKNGILKFDEKTT